VSGLLARVSHWWRSRRHRRSEEALGLLKARYQTFRTLLDSNSLAVELITDLGMRLGEGEMGGAFREKAETLVRVVGDMADKFSSLEGKKSDLVAAMHQRLAALLAEELAGLPAPGALPTILHLREVSAHGEHLCGAKAANLARFCNNERFRIPDGFVVAAPGCRLFFDHNDLALRAARLLGAGLEEDQAKLVQAAGRLQAQVREAPIPGQILAELKRMAAPFFRQGKGLAIRSSAISEDGRHHSFAGQFATVLNVTDETQLDAAFREVLASAFSPRAITYRRHAGLSPLAFDMAVLCLEMIPARAAGIIITQDPSGGSTFLVSAVLGLGEAAVGGSALADIYHVNRQGEIDPGRTVIARKEHRLVTRIGGGIGLEPVPSQEQLAPALTGDELRRLACLANEIETRERVPQDIEWAVGMDNQLVILQARPLAGGQQPVQPASRAVSSQPAILSNGQTASRGRACGRVRIVRRRDELEIPAGDDPLVLVLSQSLPDAARLVDRAAAVIVELGNPADHLANVARENGVPMLCAMDRATTLLSEGEWVLVDGEEGSVRRAGPEQAAANRRKPSAKSDGPAVDPRVERCRALLTRLNLTDAYGPSFNVLECRSMHDLVRFIHEKGVVAMFEGGDELLEESDWLVHHLNVEGIPFLLSIIDLGGALLPERPRRITPDDIIAAPFCALWQGIATQGLHWGPPPGGAVGEVFSRWLTDHQSDRPIGMPNYVIAGRDYLNLNARMDFHFIMIDAVASLDPRANHIRFRFKGGGTTAEQRARRVRCIAEILDANGFFTSVRDDLVGGDLHGAPHQVIEERLVAIGRLLGFTRLLDAAMRDDATAHQAAQAFINGDYAMSFLSHPPTLEPTQST
jgi:pyruvate,water dikinase